MVWPNEICSVKMGYCPALNVNVFEMLVDLLYKITKACARNANPYWPPGGKKKKNRDLTLGTFYECEREKCLFLPIFFPRLRVVHATPKVFLRLSDLTASQDRVCHPR